MEKYTTIEITTKVTLSETQLNALKADYKSAQLSGWKKSFNEFCSYCLDIRKFMEMMPNDDMLLKYIKWEKSRCQSQIWT